MGEKQTARRERKGRDSGADNARSDAPAGCPVHGRQAHNLKIRRAIERAGADETQKLMSASQCEPKTVGGEGRIDLRCAARIEAVLAARSGTRGWEEDRTRGRRALQQVKEPDFPQFGTLYGFSDRWGAALLRSGGIASPAYGLTTGQCAPHGRDSADRARRAVRAARSRFWGWFLPR
jgi:hypothetical protein